MYVIHRLTAATILSTLLACAAQGDQATKAETPSPSDVQSRVESGEDQHFCCQEVDLDSMSGEGCSATGKEQINSCASVLYCSGNWSSADGRARCL